MANTETATISPTSASQRLHFVDALRGFAILGILLVNISGFAGYSLFPDAGIGPVNRAVVILTQLLVVAKFYSLFSFLFGWGMAVQMERLAERSGAFLSLTLRRLFILLLIGLLHAILLWSGDILALYALLGFLLVFFRRRSPRTLLLVIVGALLFSLLWNAPVAPMESVRQSYRDFWSFTQNISSHSAEVYSEGGYWAVTERRLQAIAGRLPGYISSAGNIFAMFLLGLYAGKRRLFQTVETRLPWLRRVALVTLVAGLALNALAVWLMIRPDLFQSSNQYWRRVAQTLGAPALMLFYVSTIVLLWQRPAWQERLAPLAPVGRMALTNYLLQSVAGTLVFYGYGLGLINRIGPTTGFLLSLGFFLLQVRFSRWWLARFRFGPAEWLWRTLTYGRLQPWRRGQTAAELRPLPLLAPLGRRLRRLPPALPLVATWIVLVLWAAGLLTWYSALEAPPATAAVATATATPAAGESPAATATPTPFATPAVEPVAFEPGPVAASGDTMALAQAMSLERMQGEIEILAGPDFAGRLAGSLGGHAAGDYLAAQFEAAGLRPAGDDGTFFQTFPITYPVLPETPALAVTAPGGRATSGYELYEDYGPLVIGYAGAGHGRGQLVWAGDCSPESYTRLDTVGKVVLCAPGAGRQAFISSSRHALANGAAGLLLLTDPEEWPATFGYRLQETWVPAPLPAFRVYPEMVPDLLAGSDYDLDDLLNATGSFPLAAGAALTVTTTPARAYQARNVLGVIPGRDPAVAGEVVILGAHYDHMGQGPEGTTWFGANDNASGTALLLEIARTWQDQGFVPRRTVLFAAWDAEEWGLVGSRTYVQNPSYPLTATIANVNADMIGSGAGTLSFNGSLSAQMRALADLLGVENRQTDTSGSDHASFEQAGIPAGLLIWMDESESDEFYHLPGDTPEQIEPEKLETAATIAHLTLLDLAENRPAVDQMLARRAEAVLAGDLDAFLATTAPAHVNVDRAWFADVQRWNPVEVELSTDGVHFAGDRAVADIHLKLQAAEEAGGELYFADWEVALRRDGSAWQWAGANLQQVQAPAGSSSAMTVAAPPGSGEDLSGLGSAAARRYADIAGTLGLSPAGAADARLFIYPGESALRADTGPSLPTGQKVVVAPGTVRVAAAGDISGTAQLENALVQLVLADAGVERADAPWLWEGLAPALRAGSGEADQRATVYEQFLPRLTSALENEDPPLSDATAWGAVEYLREQIGWDGIGRFIIDLGSSGDPDLALARALDRDAAGFAAAWEYAWRNRLQTVQQDLDGLLADRATAIRAGDEDAFLGTVDPRVPGLRAAQQHFFRSLSPYAVETYSTTVSPRVFLPDGDLLAHYSLSYQLDDGQTQYEGREQYIVRFSQSDDGYRWAGLPLETVAGDKITVRYPAGEQTDARALLAEAQSLYADLASALGIADPAPAVLELFDDRELMAPTISPIFSQAAWRPSWSAPGTASKFPPRTPQEGAAGHQAVLANELTRQLLYQLGLGRDTADQWLLDGVAAYLPWSLAPGTSQPVMGHLQPLAEAARQDALFDLNSPPPAGTLSQSEFWLLQAQAWDSVHYLVEQYGHQALLDLLEARAAGAGPDAALETVLDRSPETFAAAWAESLARGHIRPERVALARDFDESAALAHVEALTDAAFAGRAAGSAGAESAANYIADQFAAYGLEPAGNLSRTTYFQSFPLTTTTAVAAPSFSTITGTTTFTYRQHYLGAQATVAGTGAPAPVVGELVWAGPDAAPETDLTGKIMLAELGENSVASLAGRAESYGAAALLLLGKGQEDADLLGKRPLLPQDTGDFPVIELTLSGSSYLMQELGLAWNILADLPPVRHFGVTARLHFAAQVESTTSANVLGLLPGSDPDLHDELLIVGAHYDHVGDDPASYLCPENPEAPPSAEQCEVVPGRAYSGANDDASGVATLLEIARLWQEAGYRPRRSVLFAAWGAQELGQLGSSHYTLSPTLRLTQTAGMLQLDGVAGGRGLNLGAQAEWAESGLWLAGIDQAWRLLDEKEIVITAPLDDSDHLPFGEQGLPTVLISWRLAGEENLPDEMAHGVSEGRLATAGRVTTLALLYLAR